MNVIISKSYYDLIFSHYTFLKALCKYKIRNNPTRGNSYHLCFLSIHDSVHWIHKKSNNMAHFYAFYMVPTFNVNTRHYICCLQEVQLTKEEQDQILWCRLCYHEAPAEWACPSTYPREEEEADVSKEDPRLQRATAHQTWPRACSQ